jgi:epoxyqueuosine reductase
MASLQHSNPASWIESVIRDFIEKSPENTLQNEAKEKAFDTPLVGFSSGDDPVYLQYKDCVGTYHWTPLEIFSLTFPELGTKAEDLTVISWVLPQMEATKSDNRKETRFPSERWARGRIFGEIVNEKLRSHVVEALEAAGYKAVAPALSPQWARKDSERYVYSSTWSERHAAYASGLGTFGLCDGLITPRGKAHRVGSVVAAISIPPTPRPYADHHAYCLFFTQGVCGKCIERCPVGALSESGHDKLKCRDHIRTASAKHTQKHYGFDGYGCGLCQTKVPCESRIPTKKDLKN